MVKVAIAVPLSKLQVLVHYTQEAVAVSKLNNIFYASLIKVSWLFLFIGCIGYTVHTHVSVMFWITFSLNLTNLCISQTYSHHHCEIEKGNFLLFYRQAVEELILIWVIWGQCIDCNDFSRLLITPKDFKYSESYWLPMSDLEIKPMYIEPSIFFSSDKKLISET